MSDTPPVSSALPQNKQVAPASLDSLLDLVKKEVFLYLNCHTIGTVQSFDTEKQTVKVQVAYKQTFFTLNDTTKTYDSVLVDYPLLLDCPVVILGGGDCTLTFPIEAGDECLVLFNDRDIDNWFKSGATGPVASNRLHSMSDGIALVGIRSLRRSLPDYDTVRAILQNGTTQVGVGPDKVLITNGTTLNTLLQNLITAVKAITVSTTVTWTGVPGSGPFTSGTPLNNSALASAATALAGLLE